MAEVDGGGGRDKGEKESREGDERRRGSAAHFILQLNKNLNWELGLAVWALGLF